MAYENPLAAGRLRHARRVERADHLDAALDARLAVAAAERVADDHADELVRLDACALDERHGDVVGARLHLHRNVGEPLHHLGPPGRAQAIDRAQIVAAADGLAEHLAAVHEQDQRVAGLQDARVDVDADVLNREPVLAVGGECVPELHPAARAQRQAVHVQRLIA